MNFGQKVANPGFLRLNRARPGNLSDDRWRAQTHAAPSALAAIIYVLRTDLQWNAPRLLDGVQHLCADAGYKGKSLRQTAQAHVAGACDPNLCSMACHITPCSQKEVLTSATSQRRRAGKINETTC